MRLSELLASGTRSGDAWTLSVPEDWGQGRSVFGGLQAALALHGMRPLARGLPLRVLQTTFVAPMSCAELRVESRLLREGKSTLHLEARMSQGGALIAVVLGVFGAARASKVHVVPRQPPVPMRAPSVGADAPRSLAFLRHFAIAWRRGGPPGSGCTATDAVVDVSLRDAGPVTEEHVVAIADAVPPQALSMLAGPAFGSSLTWTLEMLQAGRLEHLALEGWRLDVDLLAADGGYTSQSVMVWGPGGEPVAVSRQCMVVFG